MKYPTQNPTSNQGKLIRAVLTALCALILGVTAATAQNTVRMDENGNFIQSTPTPAAHDSITGKVLLKKDVAYEVFKANEVECITGSKLRKATGTRSTSRLKRP